MVEKRSAREITATEKSASIESSSILNDQIIELNFVRNKLETFQATALRDVQKRMTGMIDEVIQELRQNQLLRNEFHNFATSPILHLDNNSNSWKSNRTRTANGNPQTADFAESEATNDKIKSEEMTDVSRDISDNREVVKETSSQKYNTLHNRVFVMRESFLTSLLEVSHMKTIYHIFIIIFVCFLLNNISHEYFVKKSVTFGLEVFRKGLHKIHKVAGIWIVQHVFIFALYFAVKGWSQVRSKLAKHTTLQRLWSISCLLIYISTQLVFAYVPAKLCLYLNLPFVTASVLLLESVRLLMKMHSFVRTITPRVLSGKVKAEHESAKPVNVPTFNKYLYYLFAPTLLYRDEYPRTATIRWKFALYRFLEIVTVAFIYSYIYKHHIEYHFGNFGAEELNAASMINKFFGMTMPSVIILLSGFYLILHAWLNFTAELLCFGDRMFYHDWWTASNYDAYYRNWNLVVHDWLYEYIYKELYTYVFKGSKVLSSLTVFTISAVFHEYILGYALQLFFPVMFIFFGGIGVIFLFLFRYTSKTLGNILLWFTLITGNTMIVCLYSMEYFTRVNYAKEFNSWTDYLVPHVWSCYFK